LPKGKSGSVDGVCHEHLIFSCSVNSPILAHLFTGMMRLGHIPTKMKRDEIITLYIGRRQETKRMIPIIIGQ